MPDTLVLIAAGHVVAAGPLSQIAGRADLPFGPRDQALGGPDDSIALIRPGNADVCHAVCRYVAYSHAELVGIVPCGETFQTRPLGNVLDRRLELVATSLAPRGDVKRAGGYVEALLEAS